MMKLIRAAGLALAALLFAVPLAARAACPTAPTYGTLSGQDAATTTRTLQIFSNAGAYMATPLMHVWDGSTFRALSPDANCNLNVNVQTGAVTATLGAGSALAGKVGIDQTTPGTTNAVAANVFKKVISSTLTRIANSTAYAGTSANPQAICLFTSVTVCAPMTLTVSSASVVTGKITALRLIKSTTGATGAAFRVLVYQAAPTLTATFDATAYNPKLADLTASPTAYVGFWSCTAQMIGSDNSYYDCTSATNDGVQTFALTDGTLRFVLETTGAYAPGSGETFYVAPDIQSNIP